jgi:hypothetical protein
MPIFVAEVEELVEGGREKVELEGRRELGALNVRGERYEEGV